MDSSTQLGQHVRTHLACGAGVSPALAAGTAAPQDSALAWCEANAGFPDCMISRVVPRPEPDPLRIVAEDYNEWTTRRESFRGEKPAALSALELVDNQTARLERKLFIHNGGHATCGYLAFHRGHRYIHEAVADAAVAKHVLGALDELGEVVRRKWGFSAESIDHYKQDLCRRGAIPEMRDEVLRVIRDPIRKLSPRQRLVAPATLAVEYGLPRGEIVGAIVAALRYSHPKNPQSLALSKQFAEQGLSKVLENICGILPGSPLAVEIEQGWYAWQ